MMTAHTPQGGERRYHPPKNQSTPMDKKIHLQKKENIMRSLPPSDILSRSRMMMSGQTGYWEADC